MAQEAFVDVTKSNIEFPCDEFTVSSGIPIRKKLGVSDPRFKRVLSSAMCGEIGGDTKLHEYARPRGIDKDDRKASEDSGLVSKSSRIPMILLKKNLSRANQSVVAYGEQKLKRDEKPRSADSELDTLQNRYSYASFDNGRHSGIENAITKPEKEYVKMESLTQQAKRSVSDCTLQARNATLGGEGFGNKFSMLPSFTSATRLTRVNNWMTELKQEPEKRRSVITVIGQTQGKPFSTVLNEINQRRKLAKELDKHALCETILQPAVKGHPFKNLIAKVDFVSPEGEILYSARKIYGFPDKAAYESLRKENFQDFLFGGDNSVKTGSGSNKGEDEIPERDVPVSQIRRRKTKRTPKKSEVKTSKLTGIKNLFFDYMQNQFVISIAVLWCAVVIGIAAYFFKGNRFIQFLNLTKPKSKSWYERLFS